MRTASALFALLPLLIRTASAHFVLADSYVGYDFLNQWSFETFDDPTHGRVNYVDQPTALSKNLSYGASSQQVVRTPSSLDETDERDSNYS